MSTHVGSTRYTGTIQADGGLLAPTLDESVVGAGIIVEAVLIKDGLVDGRDVAADGILLDDMIPFFNGSFVESFDALVTSDGATVTMSIEKVGGGDLTENFSSGQTTFDCTPAATFVLTPGTDAVPQNNYVYILQSAPGVLVKSTTGWPSAEHNKIAFFSVPSASLVNTGAPGNNFVWVNQNWNDNAAETATAQGHMSDMAERLRRLPASWFSGCQGVATQDGNDLWVSIATGVVYQLHPHTFSAEDSDTAGAGDPIGVVNDPDANYAIINSLNEITKHSDGDLIGNNKYVKFVLWAVANKSGEVSPMMLNLPSEHYNTANDARIDVEGYANFTMPAAFSRESSTGFLVAAFVCKHTATAMELQETIDLRGQIPATAVGSGTGGGDVSALAVLTDNAIVRGDGGAKDVQTSTVLIADTGVMSVPGIGDGDITNFDLIIGGADYGLIKMGDACIGRISTEVGAINLKGSVICQNKSGPVTGDIEFIWTESTGGTARFVLPKSGVGLATYNSRSMLLAGPAPADTDFVKVSYWQGQGIFDNLVCDTVGSGAEFGCQGNAEFEATVFCNTFAESTTDAGVTIDGTLIKDTTITGGSASGGDLTLISTSHATKGQIVVQDQLHAQTTAAIGSGVPATRVALTITVSGTVVDDALSGTLTYSGTGSYARGLNYLATYAGSSGASVSALGAVAVGTLGMDVAAARTATVEGSTPTGNVSTVQSNASTIKVSGVAALAKASEAKHTDGDFYIASVYGKAPLAAANSPNSSSEWAGLFDGDVQISSGDKLILEGSPTSKGDTYIVYQNSRFEFFLNGILEGYVDTTGFVSV